MATFLTGWLKRLPVAVITLTLLELCTNCFTSANLLQLRVSLPPTATAQESQGTPCFVLPGCLG
jgi:hypothetical protein